jgi:early endosome antigen 1
MDGAKQLQSSLAYWIPRYLAIAVLALAVGCVSNSRFQVHELNQQEKMDELGKDIQSVNSELGKEVKKLTEKIAELQKNLDDQNTDLSTANGKITTLQSDTQSLRTELQSVRTDLNAANSRINLVKPEEIKATVDMVTTRLNNTAKTVDEHSDLLVQHAAKNDEQDQKMQTMHQLLGEADKNLLANLLEVQREVVRKIDGVKNDSDLRLSRIDTQLTDSQKFLATLVKHNIAAFEELTKGFSRLKVDLDYAFPTSIAPAAPSSPSSPPTASPSHSSNLEARPETE